MEKPTKINLTRDTPVDMDNLFLQSFQTLGNTTTISHAAGPSMKVVEPVKAHFPQPLFSLMTVALDDLTANLTIAS